MARQRQSRYGQQQLASNQQTPATNIRTQYPNRRQSPGQQQQAFPHQNQNQGQPAAAKSTSTQNLTPAEDQLIKYLDDYRSPQDLKALRDENYEIDYEKLVGIGTNSVVFLAHALTQPAVDKASPMAVKIIRLNAEIPGNQQEGGKRHPDPATSARRALKTRTGNLKLALALGQRGAESNILHVVDVFRTSERVFIFTQYCAFGSVISFIRRNGQVPMQLAQRWSAQMAAALSFLHRFHVAHRNYKLENVLVDDKLDAKLTGFGLSKLCIDLQTKQVLMSKSVCGSEPYLAPEMLKPAPERLYDPRQADVWAFGVGVFLVITRKYPFEAVNLRALRAEQLAGKYLERDSHRKLRAPARELLAWTFVVDPSQRPSSHEILANSIYLKQALPPQTPPTHSPAQLQQQQQQPQQIAQRVAAHRHNAVADANQLSIIPSNTSHHTVANQAFEQNLAKDKNNQK